MPVYRHPYYERFGINPEHFPHAERYIGMPEHPAYPAMGDTEINRVIAAVNALPARFGGEAK